MSVHHRRVIGNRVVNFELVAPPIGERGAAHAILRHDIRDFISLKNVLERADLDLELSRHAEEREDFILPVGMAMDESFAAQDFRDRFELKIAPHRQARFLFQRGLVLLRGAKPVPHDLFDAHPRLRIARLKLVAPV